MLYVLYWLICHFRFFNGDNTLIPIVVEIVYFTKGLVHGVGEAQHFINSLLLLINLVVRWFLNIYFVWAHKTILTSVTKTTKRASMCFDFDSVSIMSRLHFGTVMCGIFCF